MKAIIPVAGKGTRLYPIGIGTPKCMVRILNKPVVQWNIDALMENGIKHVILVVSADEAGERFKSFIKELKKLSKYENLTVDLAVQKKKLGTAHVLQKAKDFFNDDERFIFINGDDVYSPQIISDLLKEDLATVGREVDDPEKWGIFKTKGDNVLDELVEKPQDFIGNVANIGCYLLHSRIFDLFDKIELSPRGEFEITDTITLLAKEKEIKVLSSDGYWLPVGYPWNILTVTDTLIQDVESDIQGKVADSVEIHGNVVLPASSEIKGLTHIEGNLIVGENTVVGPQASIRGNVVIGNNSSIVHGSEIKSSVIGDNCVISQSYVGDSVFGNNINFPHSIAISSNNSFILDDTYVEPKASSNVLSNVKGKISDLKRAQFGTVIGDNCKISVGTKIRPGVKLWTNSTTKPGQIVTKDMINTWG